MQTRVFRQFITMGNRQIHYRRAGQGAPVIVLHQSPTSSRECEPIMRRLAPCHSVFAPDMPGYGASDPAESSVVSIEELADNVAAFMDVLAIEKAGIYGFHTGASVANAFARRHPERVSASVLMGLLCLDSAEREDLLQHYTPPFVPQWDGGHLAWLWSRLKDQSLFFPWYARTAAARLGMDGALPATIQANLRDWLRCGEGYANAYRAAFRYQPEIDLPHIRTPHFVLAFSGDPLFAHLGRLPASGGHGAVRRCATPAEAETVACDLLNRYPGSGEPAAEVATRPMRQRSWQDYVQVGGLQLRVLRAGHASMPSLLLIHGAQSSVTAWTGLIESLSHSRSVFALELPGHGESDGLPDAADYGVESLADLASEAIKTLSIPRLELLGIEAGAAVQVAVAARHSTSVTGLRLLCAIDVAGEADRRERLLESYSAEVTPDFFGGHLLRAWHEARDHVLFFPWYERHREHGTREDPLLDAVYLHKQTVDTVIAGAAGHAIRRAEVCFSLAHHLAGRPYQAHFAAPRFSARFMHTQALASGSGRQFIELPRDLEGWAAVLSASHRA